MILIKVILESLEDGVACLLVTLEVVAVLELFNGLLLLTAECFRYIDADIYYQVALTAAITLNSRQSLSSQTQGLARLCTVIEFHLQFGALNRWDLHFTAKCSCGEVEQEVIDKVVAITHEGVIWLFLNEHLDVTVQTVMLASVTLARHVDHHTFGYTSGDADLNNLFAFLYTSATTLLTLVLDNLTFAAADRTNALLLHHTEDTLGGVGNDTASMTGRTSLLATSSLGA